MLFSVILSALIQGAIPEFTALGQARVPLLIGAVIYYALNRESEHMVLCAFLAGLLQDGLSMMPMGCSVLCFCVIGYIAGKFRGIVDAGAWITPVAFGGLAAFVSTLLFYGVLAREGMIHCSFWWALLKALGAGLLGLVSTPIIFRILGRMEGATLRYGRS